MTLTIVKRINGMGKAIDETYQPLIPELVELLSEVCLALGRSSPWANTFIRIFGALSEV